MFNQTVKKHSNQEINSPRSEKEIVKYSPNEVSESIRKGVKKSFFELIDSFSKNYSLEKYTDTNTLIIHLKDGRKVSLIYFYIDGMPRHFEAAYFNSEGEMVDFNNGDNVMKMYSPREVIKFLNSLV